LGNFTAIQCATTIRVVTGGSSADFEALATTPHRYGIHPVVTDAFDHLADGGYFGKGVIALDL
jgi:hypothetical protein